MTKTYLSPEVHVEEFDVNSVLCESLVDFDSDTEIVDLNGPEL